MFRFVAFFLATMAFASVLHAQDENRQFTILQNWQPTDEACNPSIAVSVSLSDLLREPDSHQGMCVRIEGFYRGRALFLQKRDIRRKYPSQNKTSENRRLGIYASDDQFRELARSDATKVRLVGLVSRCDALRDANTIMVMGYCHYTDGPIIGLPKD
ncbi:MAG: hypothetical protein VXW22_04590 [Pseudomonadota bacterium]|nr:hypothetical protein [Pseudomonadota bacterium]